MAVLGDEVAVEHARKPMAQAPQAELAVFVAVRPGRKAYGLAVGATQRDVAAPKLAEQE